MTKTIAKKISPTQRKRSGGHHKKTKRYHTTYHPFIPLLVIVLGLFFSVAVRTTPSLNVLAFATEMSSQGLLEATNRQRARNSAPGLTLNESLSNAAQQKAEDMARRDYWSHETPDGEQPWVFIHQAGYKYSKAGENLAYGFTTSEQTINGWMNSDSHRENMLDSAFIEVGFGYVNAVNYQDSAEETIIVALYALPATVPTITMTVPENEVNTPPSPGDAQVNSSGEDTEIPVVVASSSPTDAQTLQQVSRVESLLDNRFSWATFALGIVSGSAGVGFLASHGLRVRKWMHKSEQFILHHPLLDATLLLIVGLGFFLLDGVGYLL